MKLDKKVILGLFAAVAIIQLAVPASMVFKFEKVKSSGVLYRFRTKPVDPADVFRGRYVRLSYGRQRLWVNNPEAWKDVSEAYAVLGTDEEGFALVTELRQNKPSKGDFIEVERVHLPYHWDIREEDWDSVALEFSYPFDRYYMREDKAPKAESFFREVQRKDSVETFAQVKVMGGKYVLEDVVVGDKSLKDWVE